MPARKTILTAHLETAMDVLQFTDVLAAARDITGQQYSTLLHYLRARIDQLPINLVVEQRTPRNIIYVTAGAARLDIDRRGKLYEVSADAK